MSRRRKKKYKGPARDALKEGVNPRLAEGLTEGLDAKRPDEAAEIDAILPSGPSTPGVEAISHLRDDRATRLDHVPAPRFYARDDVDSGLVTTFGDGRHFRDKEMIFPPDVLNAIKAGYICLKCLEPQPYAFADEHLPGCEGVALRGDRYMRDWQIMDVAMEMEGEVHLGPQKPISEYLLDMDVRQEKREFERRILEGRSRGRG